MPSLFTQPIAFEDLTGLLSFEAPPTSRDDAELIFEGDQTGTFFPLKETQIRAAGEVLELTIIDIFYAHGETRVAVRFR